MPTYSPTNLTLRLDASVGAHVWQNTDFTSAAGDGDLVGALDDVGDIADSALFNTSTTRPTYRTSGINGLGALDFDGTNDFMQCYNDAFVTARPISTFITNSAYTIFLSLMLDGDGTNLANIYDNAATYVDAGGFFGLHYKTTLGVHSLIAYNWDGNADVVPLTVTQGVPIVAMVRHEGGNLYFSLDGGAESSVASGNTSNVAGQLALGRSLQGGAGHFNGRIGEVLFYNAALSGTDLTDTYQYMLDKWSGVAVANNFPALTVAI